jgi:hypothetical protein
LAELALTDGKRGDQKRFGFGGAVSSIAGPSPKRQEHDMSVPPEGHTWPLDLDQARSGDKPVNDTPLVGDAVPAVQPDTDRQPRVSAARFDYPLPGVHGTLGD